MTTDKKTYETRIIGTATAPTGDAGILVECTCSTHPEGMSRAILRAVTREGIEANPVLIHGHVLLAHHPALSRAPKIRKNGPWRVA